LLSDKIGLHKIANASDDEPLVTLHLYSPPFESCTVFLDLQGQQKETRNFCFFSEQYDFDCLVDESSEIAQLMVVFHSWHLSFFAFYFVHSGVKVEYD
jgi:hypothetical protein